MPHTYEPPRSIPSSSEPPTTTAPRSEHRGSASIYASTALVSAGTARVFDMLMLCYSSTV
eukprot:1268677-Rhodomonas_salina.1